MPKRVSRTLRYRVEPLEPRVLLAADWAAGLAPSWTPDAEGYVPDSELVGSLSSSPEPVAGSVDTSELPGALDLDALSGLRTSQDSESPLPDLVADPRDTPRTELVVIDAGVAGYEELLADLNERSGGDVRYEFHVLDSDADGVQALSDLLGRHRDLDAVHVVSHGSAGSVQLGNARLDDSSIGAYANYIRAWSGTLADDADLLFYGCDLASSTEGRALVERLAQLTGTDIAASDDLTGTVALGGDWDLEHATGLIESAVPFSTPAQQDWQGVLASDPVWLSTRSDVTNGGQPGDDTWQDEDLILIGDPNLSFGPTTNGTFSVAFDTTLYAPTADLNATHYVTRNIEVGASNFPLKAGDLLLSTVGTSTFNSGSTPTDIGFANNITVDNKDVFVFRPDTPGDYSAGTFAMLLENATGNGDDTTGISLIERDVTVGDANLEAGDFLYTRVGDNDVFLFETIEVGAGVTDGNRVVLLEGSNASISIDNSLYGVDVVEKAVTLGTRALPAGTVLLTSQFSQNVGANNLPVTDFDVYALDVSQTTLVAGAGNGVANASMFFDGGDVGFDTAAEELRSITLTTPNNDAPMLSGGPYSLTGTDEDTTSTGVQVSTILGGLTKGDVDGDPLGLAVTTASGNGTWQYSTDSTDGSDGTWTSFGAVASNSALLLSNTTWVRYDPDTVSGETATLTFHAWDSTTGSASTTATPSTGDPAGGGGTTAYSNTTAQANLVVTDLNDAPGLADDNPTLTAIAEDDFTSAGDSVAAIVVNGSITDPDGAPVESIAITAVDNTNGTWQYSTDNGGSWNNVDDGSLAVDHALLLDGTLTGGLTQKLRFVPAADYNGSADVTFRAWDMSAGSAGTYADTTSAGSTTPYSTTTDMASIAVNPVNDAPTLSVPTKAFINEIHYDNVGVDTGEAVEIAAPAGTDLSGFSLVFYNGFTGTVYRTEPLAGVVPDQGDNFGTLVFNLPVNGIQNGDSAADGIAFVDAGGMVLEFISYEGALIALDGPAAGMASTDIGVAEDGTTPIGHSLQLTGAGSTFTWSAAAANTLGAANTGQTFTAVSDALNETVAEDASLAFGTATSNAIAVADVDEAEAGATDPLSMSLSVSNGSLTLGGTVGLFNVLGNGTATVTFQGKAAEINTALDGLTYQPDPHFNGTDLLTIVVDDQGNTGSPGDLTDTGQVIIDVTPVNDEPTLTATGSNPTFTEDGAAASLFTGASADTVESGQTFTDLTLTVTNVTDGADEILNADGTAIALTNANSGTTATNALSYSVSVSGGTATLTLSGGTMSAAQLQSLVDVLSYQNDSDNPSTANRVVTLTEVKDSGGTANGGDDTTTLGIASTVTVNAQNDAPTLTATGSNPTFTEGGAAASLFTGASAGTVESGQTFTDLTLTVTNVTDGADEIVNADGSAIALTNGNSGTTASNSLSYSVSVSSSTATVALSGGTLSAVQLQTLIDALSYQNDSDDPSTANRVVTLTEVKDSGGTANGGDDTATLSLASTVTVNAVNDEPTLTATGSNSTFTEDGAAASLFTGASAGTVESGQTFTDLTLTVTNVTDGADEILNADGSVIALTNANSGTTANNSLSFSVSVSGGTATVALSGGTMSAAELQTLVDALSYQNDSDDPSTANRVVTLTEVKDSGGTANGGDDTATLSLASTVTVNAVNDEPTLTATGSNPTFTEDGAAASLFTGASAGTVESGQTFTDLTLTVTNVTDGADEILNADGSAIALTNANSGTTANNSLSFSVSVSAGTATLSLSGGSLSTAALQTLVDALSYQNDSDTPATVNRVVTLTEVKDSGGTANGGDDTAALSLASTVTVNAQNDAPTLSGGPYNLTGTDEDTTSTGVQVSTILAGLTNNDADGNTLGLAVTTTAGNGTWQYSTDSTDGSDGTWTNFGAVAGNSALLLSDTTWVRYDPDTVSGETATLTFHAWDATTGTASTTGTPSTADPAGGGGTTAYSSTTAQANLVVTDLNDAPGLADDNPTLTAIAEDDFTSPGDSVAAVVVDGSITDPDGAPVESIAIIKVDNTNGTWQYSTDNAGTWSNVDDGSLAVDHALLLDGTLTGGATQKLRFVPAADYNGSADVTFRAWDMSAGAAATYADTTTSGGSTAYSSVTDTASIAINAVNDEPTLNATGSNPTFTEDGAAVSLFTGASADTVESGQTFTDLTLTVTNVTDGADEIVNADGSAIALTNGNTGTTATNSLSYSVSVSAGTATLTLSGGALSTAALQTLVDALSYQNNSDNPSTANRVVTLTEVKDSGGTANGGDDTAALSLASTVTVTEVNDEPTLSATGSNPTFTEGGAAASLFTGASADTVESGQTFTDLTLTVTNVTDGADEILNADGTAIALTNGNTGTTATNSLSYSVSVSAGTATLTLSGGALSTAALQTLVDALSYQNNSDTPSTANRVVTLTEVKDSGGTANGGDDTAALNIASTVTVNAVNDEPTLTAAGSNPTFTEGSTAASLFTGASADTVESGQTFTDLTLTVTNVTDGADEILNADGSAIALTNANSGTTATNSLGYTVSVSSGTATVTFSGGTLSTAALQTLVDALSYQNNSDTPTTANRVVTLTEVKDSGGTANGGDDTATLSITSTVTVNAQNDAPVLADDNPSLTAIAEDDFTSAGDSVAAIVVNGSITDPDGAAVESIAITTVDNTNGTWQYSTDNGGTWNNVDDGSLAVNHALLLDGTLTGGATQKLRFVPDPSYNGSAVFTFRAWDMSAGAAATYADTTTSGSATPYSTATDTASIAVNPVNDAPTLSGGPYSLTGTDEDTTSTGVQVSTILGGLTNADLDGDPLGLAVTTATGNGTWQYSTDSTDGSDGTWTSFGAVASNSALLLSNTTWVRYDPDTVSGETATLTFHAWDATTGSASTTGTPSSADPAGGGSTTAYSSTTAQADLVVTDLNDAPVLADDTPSLSAIAEDDVTSPGDSVAAIVVDGSITDPDGAAVESIAITAVDNTNGTWQYSTDNGGTWNNVDDGSLGLDHALLLDGTLTGGATQKLRFVPAADYNGSADVTFRAWDMSAGAAATYADTTTSGSATPYSTATDTASITINPVNDEPTLSATGSNPTFTENGAAASLFTGASASTVESGQTFTDLTLTVSNVTDGADEILNADGTAIALTNANSGTTASNSLSYSVSVSAGTATLTLSGGSLSTAALQTLVDALSFQNDSDTPTTANRVVTLTEVIDSGGTANGGDDTAAVNITSTVTVNAQNDAPVLADDTPSLSAIAEDDFTSPGDSVAAIVVDGSITDPDGAAVESIAITAVDNTNGTWQYSTDNGGTWNNVDDGSLAVDHALLLDGTLTGGAAQKLRFVPDPSYNGSAVFTFRAWDMSAGTAATYADTTTSGNTTPYSTATDTASIAINAVNDEPSFVTLGNQNVLEDSGAHTVAGFANALPGGGADEAGQTFSYTLSNDNPGLFTVGPAIDASGQLTYTLNPNAAGTATVTVSVTDSGGTASGGDDTSPDQTFDIDVAQVNDPPAGADATVTTPKDTAYVFSTADFGFSDPVEADALLGVAITTLPGVGALVNNGSALAAGDTVSSADIAAGRLVFTPPPGASGIAYATFMFRVQDAGGTAAGGVDVDPSANRLTIDVTAPPDPVSPPISPPVIGPVLPPIPPPDSGSNPPPGLDAGEPPEEPSESASTLTDPPSALSSPDSDPTGSGAAVNGLPTGDGAAAIADPSKLVADRGRAQGGASVPDAPVPETPDEPEQSPSEPEAARAEPREFEVTRADLALGLDRMRDTLEEETGDRRIELGQSTGAAVGLSVGYVSWLLRGGVLLSSVLSSLPAWRFIDPLPVFAATRRRADDDDDDESLEAIVEGGAEADPTARADVDDGATEQAASVPASPDSKR